MSEQTGQVPPNFEIVGNLQPEEKALLDSLREQANNVVRRIGELEVNKARLLGALSDTEQRVDGILKGVSKRLNLPEGRRWHVTGENVYVEMGELASSNPSGEG